MTRLYKQATRDTATDDGNERTSPARLTSTDLLYRLDLQRQVAPGSERTFGQWAIQALLDDEKNAHDPGTSKQDEKSPAAVYSSYPLTMNIIFANGAGIASPAPHEPGTTEQATRPSSNALIADENSNMPSNSPARK